MYENQRRAHFLALVLVLYLSPGAVSKIRGTRVRIRGGSTSYNNYGGGGGGDGEGMSTGAIIGLLCGLTGLAIFVLCCICVYKSTLPDDTTSKRPEEETTAQRAEAQLATVRSQTRTEPQVRYSSDILEKVEVPHNITEQEELELYNKTLQIGELLLQIDSLNQLDYKKKNYFRRFNVLFTDPFGDRNRCNGCRLFRMSIYDRWYRCRICVDIDLCERCFTKGPTVTAENYRHALTHQCALLQKHIRCSGCKLLVIDTKFQCENCESTYFCLGCYKKGYHNDKHSGHNLTRIGATSILMKRLVPSPTHGHPASQAPQPTAPVLDPGTGRAAYRPQPCPPAAPHVPPGASPVHDASPPAYEDCIYVPAPTQTKL